MWRLFFFFFFQAEDGIRDLYVTGVQTCALPIFWSRRMPAFLSTRGMARAGPMPMISGAQPLTAYFTRRAMGLSPCESAYLRLVSKIGRASCREREQRAVDATPLQ